MPEQPRRMTINEAVRFSPEPVSERTLRRAILRQDLPAVKVLGKYRIETSELFKFLKLEPPPGTTR